MKQFFRKLKHQLNQKVSKFIVAVLMLCLIIRLLPYFAPIHAIDITQNQLALQFIDRYGLPLGTVLTRDQEHTAVVPLNQVSPQFIRAILAAEDGSFYQHGALDIKAIFRAIREAVQAKKVVSGASTITMQLARMLEPSPRNLSGKLQEIWLSWRLVAGMNKDEILSAYINRLPMGGNIYGVEAAAQIYFSIPASDLNLAQASLLAAIPNNPTYFNPFQHWDRLKKRQKYVLRQMVEDGYIKEEEAARIYTEKVVFQSRPKGIIAAPHFLFWMAERTPPLTPPRKRGGEQEKTTLFSHHQRGSEQEKTNLFSHHQRGGEEREIILFQIRTTIDRNLQQFVEAQVQQVIKSLASHNVHDAAALVIDNHSGEVLAYVGSPDYFNEVKLGRNDGVQALRQPGSTLKPFLYELGLEKRVIRPHTILADVPIHYAIPGGKLYSPADFSQGFMGPVRVRVALANSLNIPAVRVLEKVGVENFLNRLRKLGFENLKQDAEFYGLGLTLGSGEVSLWELARAYLTIARMGESVDLVTVLPHPPTLFSANKEGGIFQGKREIWQLIADILSDRFARAAAFGVDSVLNLPFAAAVKTGTSSNFRDTWTVGFTTDYTVATWVGNFTGEPMRQVSGVTGAAPLWNRIMLHLHEHKSPANFSPPESLVKLPICAITGLKPTPECNSIVQEYFYPEDQITYNQPQNFALSPEYDEWLARQQSSQLISHQLKIISPHNGDLFLFYPDADAEQKLEFKVAGKLTQPLELWLNGNQIASQLTNSIFWRLSPGNWTLEARSGEMIDRINFQVQLANFPLRRRGFSVTKPTRSSQLEN